MNILLPHRAISFYTNIDSGTAKPITLIKEIVINAESKK